MRDLLLGHLPHVRRVLLAGCGGGYDILGEVPLVHALRGSGVEVELASLSFCYLNGLDGAAQDPAVPNLYAVTGACATEGAYYPRAWRARWLDATHGGAHTVWCFDKAGVRPLARAYRALATRHGLDAIVLIDGGIDAVLCGDETSLGTPSEDLAALAAVTELDVPVVLACVGLSAELRDGIAHAQVFARVIELARLGAYRGASALVAGTPACDAYLPAVFAGQQQQKRSHVHDVIMRSARGEFGAVAPHVWLSALANMYWVFDGRVVVRTHAFLDALRPTASIWEVAARIEGIRKELPIQAPTAIPL